jgi:hypothetical protein
MTTPAEWAARVAALLVGQLRLWAGLTASVTGALLTSTHLLPDGPTKHVLQVAFTVSTAITAYFLHRPNTGD